MLLVLVHVHVLVLVLVLVRCSAFGSPSFPLCLLQMLCHVLWGKRVRGWVCACATAGACVFAGGNEPINANASVFE